MMGDKEVVLLLLCTSRCIALPLEDVVISKSTANRRWPAMLLHTTLSDRDTALKSMDTISIRASSTLSAQCSPSPRNRWSTLCILLLVVYAVCVPVHTPAFHSSTTRG